MEDRLLITISGWLLRISDGSNRCGGASCNPTLGHVLRCACHQSCFSLFQRTVEGVTSSVLYRFSLFLATACRIPAPLSPNTCVSALRTSS